MKTKSSFAVLIFFIILGIGIALAYASYDVQDSTGAIWIGVIASGLRFPSNGLPELREVTFSGNNGVINHLIGL